jgi:hypothetical protein
MIQSRLSGGGAEGDMMTMRRQEGGDAADCDPRCSTSWYSIRRHDYQRFFGQVLCRIRFNGRPQKDQIESIGDFTTGKTPFPSGGAWADHQSHVILAVKRAWYGDCLLSSMIRSTFAFPWMVWGYIISLLASKVPQAFCPHAHPSGQA